MNYKQLLQQMLDLLSTAGEKAPVIMAFIMNLVNLFQKFVTDLGGQTPANDPNHGAPIEEIRELESRVVKDHKLGDGTFLKILQGLLTNPTFGPILMGLLGQLLGGIGKVPAPAVQAVAPEDQAIAKKSGKGQM